MTPPIEPVEAATALDEIAGVVRALKQSRIYRTASSLMLLWGVVVALGYLITYAAPSIATHAWIVLQLAATALTLAFCLRPDGSAGAGWRFGALMLLIFAFGLTWSVLLGHMGPREMNAFWATFFMFCYAVAGLWFGRMFVALGLAVSVLTIAGYYWSGPWFEPYMALVDGGGLIVCGLWMRRA